MEPQGEGQGGRNVDVKSTETPRTSGTQRRFGQRVVVSTGAPSAPNTESAARTLPQPEQGRVSAEARPAAVVEAPPKQDGVRRFGRRVVVNTNLPEQPTIAAPTLTSQEDEAAVVAPIENKVISPAGVVENLPGGDPTDPDSVYARYAAATIAEGPTAVQDAMTLAKELSRLTGFPAGNLERVRADILRLQADPRAALAALPQLNTRLHDLLASAGRVPNVQVRTFLSGLVTDVQRSLPDQAALQAVLPAELPQIPAAQDEDELQAIGTDIPEAAQLPEWRTWGQEWVRIANEEHALNAAVGLPADERKRRQDTIIARRDAVFQQIADRHPSAQRYHLYNDQQGYHYFFLKPHDQAAWDAHQQAVAGVNNAQDQLTADIRRIGPGVIQGMPTGELKNALPSLEAVSREAKIHLMPTLIQEPKALDMLLDLLEQRPELRDEIQVMKMRARNNGTADQLPEVVLYTTREKAPEILDVLEQHFLGVSGEGRAPRFNREVANGLLYIAESGGDLKEELRDMGEEVLDKIFDKDSGHAAFRTRLGL